MSAGLDKDSIKKAKNSAEKHPIGIIKNLPFTESHYEWVILYEHIRKGQITPWAMRNMRRKDLYFIAGLSFPHPALMRSDKDKSFKYSMELSLPFNLSDSEDVRWEQLTKIQGNAIRAQEEIRYRNFFWATFFVVLAAIVGSFSAWMLSVLFKITI